MNKTLLHRVLPVCLVPLSAALWLAHAAEGVSVLQLVGDSEREMASGNHAAAQDFARQAVETDPAWPPAWRQLGLALLRGDRPADAIPPLQRAVGLAESDDTAWRALAQALWRQDQPHGAVNALSAYLRLKPQDAVAWRDMANWLVRLGRAEQAIPALLKVLELKPDDPAAWRELGVLHLRQGRTAEAASAFERSLQSRPNDAAVLRDLGWCLWTLKRRPEALARLEQALAHEVPEREQVVFQVVARLAEEGDGPEALAFYRRTHPDAPLADVALDLARRGRLVASEPLLMEAWKTDAQPPPLVGLYLAYVRAVNGRTADIAPHLAPFLAQAAQAPDEQLDLAVETLRLASANPDVPRLLAQLETAVSRRPAFDTRITDVLEKAAEERRARRDPRQALALYRRVLERDPNRTAWIWAYRLAAEREEAGEVDTWLAALHARAAAPAVRTGIEGVRFDRARQPQQAVDSLAQSIALEPMQPVLRQVLFQNLLKLGRLNAARDEALWFARRVDEGDAFLRSYLAEMWTRLGETEEALVHWQLLHISYPETSYYGLETAFALYRLGRAQEAIETLETMAATSRDPQVFELLAEIHSALDQPDQAVAWSARGLETAPSPGLLRYHAEGAERLARYPEALASAEAFLAQDPGYTPMALLAARALFEMGRTNAYAALHAGLLERNPLFLPSLVAGRDEAIRDGRFDDACALAQRRLELQPDSLEAKRQYAHALAQNDRFRHALKILRPLARTPREQAVPVLVYQAIATADYPGRNSVDQIARHIASLAGAGYAFVNAPDELDSNPGTKRVMIILLDPDAQVVEALDPVLVQHGARVVFAGNSALPPRHMPSLPFPDRLQPLLATGRWKPASSGPEDIRRRPVTAAGVLGNPLLQPVWTEAQTRESSDAFSARIDGRFAEAARPLEGEPVRLLVYPAGDFGQRGLDLEAARNQPDPVVTLDPVREAVARHFTHAVYFDESGFRLPGHDPLRIPARLVPPLWDADALADYLTRSHPLARARFELAQVLYWNGQYESAIREFARAEQEGADPLAIAFNWGLAAERQGDTPTALRQLRQARELDPESPRIAAAIERTENRNWPVVQVFHGGWEDNEDRRYLQHGLTANFSPFESLRVGATFDRNRWETEGVGIEDGNRWGVRALAFLRPQVWLSVHGWLLDMDEIDNRWGGTASLRVPNPWLNGSLEFVAGRQEIETLEALRADIDSRLAAVRTYTRLRDAFDLFADFTHNDRTDGNVTDMLEGRLLHRVKEWPYIGTGLRFRFADSDIDPPEYWSPEELQQYQWHVNLRGSWNRLRGSVSGDAGYARERGTDWRFVWGARGEAEWRFAKRLVLQADLGWFEGPVYERLSWGVGLSAEF